MTSSESLLSTLQEQGYVSVPFPRTHRDIETAVAAFFGVLKLPQETKNKLRFKRETDMVSDIGYVRTQGEQGEDHGKRDFKEYFHYHPDAHARFADDLAREPRLATFLQAADELFHDAESVVRAVLKNLDTRYPGVYETFCPQNAPLERILRFLKYDNRGTEGEFLARAHFDRGGCTLAIAESAPGLRIGKGSEDLTLVHHEERHALFFGAPQLEQITRGGISPAWHDVVQAPGQHLSSDASRWAVVYFVNAPGHAFPSSIQTHTQRT